MAFGLTELKNGSFPHIINRTENQNYIAIPALKYYDYNNMKENYRERFSTWYSNRVSKNYVFDYQKEIQE